MLPYIFTDLIILVVVTITLWVWMWIVPVRVIKVKRLYMGARGLALPGFIFLTEGAWREDVLRHELAHQAQMRKYSPLGAVLLLGCYYGLGFVKGRIKNGCWPDFWSLWQTNPLEIKSNAAMDSPRPLPRLIGWRSDGNS